MWGSPEPGKRAIPKPVGNRPLATSNSVEISLPSLRRPPAPRPRRARAADSPAGRRGRAARPRRRRPCDGYQASPESRNPLVPVPPMLPSPPAPRWRRGPGRGAQGAFANQKNHRAQNDLGRSPPKAQHRPLGLLQTRPTRQKRSRTSLRGLPGRRSCAQEAQECPRAATLVLRRYASMA